jgi:hypothetical protein
VDDVEQTLVVDGDVMGGLPGVFIGQLRPVVEDLVLVLAGADDELFFRFLRREDPWCGDGQGGGGEETTAGKRGCFHKCLPAISDGIAAMLPIRINEAIANGDP